MNKIGNYIGEKIGDMVEDAVKGALGIEEKKDDDRGFFSKIFDKDDDKEKKKEKDDDDGGFFSKVFDRDDDREREKKKEEDDDRGFFSKVFDKDDDDGREKKSGFKGLFNEQQMEGAAGGNDGEFGGGSEDMGGPTGQSVAVSDGDLFNDLMDVAEETHRGE